MHPFNKGLNHLIMIVKVSSFNKSSFRMPRRHFIREPIDAVNQDA